MHGRGRPWCHSRWWRHDPHTHNQTSPATRVGVRVAILPWPRRQAVCTCWWRGRRRPLRCMTVFDALTHAPAAGCEPPVPRVFPRQSSARLHGGPPS
jgi:hypothetical protein